MICFVHLRQRRSRNKKKKKKKEKEKKKWMGQRRRRRRRRRREHIFIRNHSKPIHLEFFLFFTVKVYLIKLGHVCRMDYFVTVFAIEYIIP